MKTDDVNRELTIQNTMNVSVVDTILNIRRVFVLALFPILYFYKGAFVAVISIVIVSFLIYKYLPVSIRDKEDRIDYIILDKLDFYGRIVLKFLIKKTGEFLRW